MAASEHYCKNGWADGPVRECGKHRMNKTKTHAMKWGPKIRRKMDREIGAVGRQSDSGEYING